MIQDLILMFGVWPWYRLSTEHDSRGLALLVYASKAKDGPFVPIQRLPNGLGLTLDDKIYYLEFDNPCDFSPLDQPISIGMLWDNITLQLNPRDRTIETLVHLFEVLHTDDMVSTLDAICGGIPSLPMHLDTDNPGEYYELLRRQPYQHPFSIRATKVGNEALEKRGLEKARVSYFVEPPHPGVKFRHPDCDCWAGVWMTPDGSYQVQGHSIPEPAGPFPEDEALCHFEALIKAMCTEGFKSAAHKDLHHRRSVARQVVPPVPVNHLPWFDRVGHLAKAIGEELFLQVQVKYQGPVVTAICQQAWTSVEKISNRFSIKGSSHYEGYSAADEQSMLHHFETFFRHALTQSRLEEGRLAEQVRDVACELEKHGVQVWIDRAESKYRLSTEVRGERRWIEIHWIKHDLYAILPDYQTNRIEYQDRSLALLALKQKAECIFTNPNCTPKNTHHKLGRYFDELPNFIARFTRLARELNDQYGCSIAVGSLRHGHIRYEHEGRWAEIERGVREWVVRTNWPSEATFPNEEAATSKLIGFVRDYLIKPEPKLISRL